MVGIKTKAIAAIGGIALIAGAFFLGVRYAEGRAAVAQQRAIDRALAQAAAVWEQDRLILEQSQKVIYRTREVVRYVQREAQSLDMAHCPDLGADWIRLRNKSINAANAASAR